MKDEKGGMLRIGKEEFMKQGKEVWDEVVEKLGVSKREERGGEEGDAAGAGLIVSYWGERQVNIEEPVNVVEGKDNIFLQVSILLSR